MKWLIFRKRFNLDRPDRKSPLFLLPSNAALFLKGLYTRLARGLACQSSGTPAAAGFYCLLLGGLVLISTSCMSNGTSDGQALEVHLDNPSVCDGLVWLGTFSSAPSGPLMTTLITIATTASPLFTLVEVGMSFARTAPQGSPDLPDPPAPRVMCGPAGPALQLAAITVTSITTHRLIMSGEKITGTWTDSRVNTQGGTGASGSAGAAGNVWSSGTGAAAGGNNGDFYYNTSTYHVWEKITGTYGSRVNPGWNRGLRIRRRRG